MLESELTARLAYWQKALRLQDWTVTAKMVRYGELATDASGHIIFSQALKDATLSIVTAETYPRGDRFSAHDEEETLVHELLHLHFAPFQAKPETPEELSQEQAINAIATALVAEHRRAEQAQQQLDFKNAPF